MVEEGTRNLGCLLLPKSISQQPSALWMASFQEHSYDDEHAVFSEEEEGLREKAPSSCEISFTAAATLPQHKK